MRIIGIDIQNFRKLFGCHIDISKETTLFVGANNSGKTSAMDEKLFGVKLKTETDIKNEREGKDNSITRTTRLFYVACTRAQKSLAIIAYTYDCEAVKATAMKNNWFEDDEIRLLE